MSDEMGQAEGALRDAAGKVELAKQDFDRLAKDLEARIQAAASGWKGQGGNAFQGLGAAWVERQRRINNALNDFEQSLRSTEQTNMSTDEAQSVTMSRLQQRL